MSKIQLFVISDTHGLFDQWWKVVLDSGFDINNENHRLILNGDMVERTHGINQACHEWDKIFSLIFKTNSIIYLLGNNEFFFFNQLPSKYLFIKHLPMVYKTKKTIVVHGWINPDWSLNEHQFKKRSFPDMQSFENGSLIFGSPAYILNHWANAQSYQNYNYEGFFGYKNLDNYLQKFNDKYPNILYIVGHSYNFKWDYEPIATMNNLEWEAFCKNLKEPNNKKLLDKLYKEYNVNDFYQYKNIVCTDVFSKVHLSGFDPFFKVFKTVDEKKYELYTDNDKDVYLVTKQTGKYSTGNCISGKCKQKKFLNPSDIIEVVEIENNVKINFSYENDMIIENPSYVAKPLDYQDFSEKTFITKNDFENLQQITYKNKNLI